MDYPFRGEWLVQNSPANRVPSHGTATFALTYAIDFVPVDDRRRSAPLRVGSLWRPEPPAAFTGFGRDLLAPIDGEVVAVHDGDDDHSAYRGLPSLWYAVTQGKRARLGWAALAGNHVMIRDRQGVVLALCHLMRDSARVRVGQRVAAGDVVGRCGNSGNSTEPHVHVQAMSGADPATAVAVPLSFRGALPRNGEVISTG